MKEATQKYYTLIRELTTLNLKTFPDFVEVKNLHKGKVLTYKEVK